MRRYEYTKIAALSALLASSGIGLPTVTVSDEPTRVSFIGKSARLKRVVYQSKLHRAHARTGSVYGGKMGRK